MDKLLVTGGALVACSLLPGLANSNADIEVDDVVVTATRFIDHYLDRPVNITVISAKQIEQSAAKTVPDLLAAEAGVVLSDLFGNNAASTTVDLRGFGVTGGRNTLVLVDGRRIADNDLSGVKWSSLPLSSIERIEVVRGGGAVLYGEGAVGGTINIITRSPIDSGTQASIKTGIGSLGTSIYQADANIRGDAAGISLSASKYSSDGYRDNNSDNESVVHTDMRWFGDANTVSLKLGADRQEIRLPGARSVQPSTGLNELENDRQGTSTPKDFSTRDGEYATIAWSSMRPAVDSTIELGYRQKAETSNFDFSGFPDYRETGMSVWHLTPRAKLPFDFVGVESQLVVGVDYYQWDYSLDKSNAPANITIPVNRVRADQSNLAIYAQHTARPTGALTLIAGWRQERQDADATDAYDPAAPGGATSSGAPAASQDVDEHAYELSGRYEFDGGVAATVKTDRSYRLATIDEIYESSPTFSQEFQFLRPQTARTHEIGVERRWLDKFLRAALFQIDVRDEIHLDAFSTGVGNTNLPPSRRRGLELTGGVSGERFSVRGGYSYTDAKFLEGKFAGSAFTTQNVDISGKAVPLVPKHKLSITANMQVDSSTRVSSSLVYVGEQYMDNDEANDFGTKIPSYLVVDFKLTHSLGPLTVGTAINNLFDEKYYSYAVRSASSTSDKYNAYPLPERTFSLFAEYRFGD